MTTLEPRRGSDDTGAGAKRRGPSMRDVAVLAGVSHQTVSRVLNGHNSIKNETREKVLAAIASVNYRRNSVARTLATSRSQRIGVIVDSAGLYGPNSTLRAIEESAWEAGYAVSAITVSGNSAITTQEALDSLIAQGVDALCVIAPRITSVDTIRQSTHDLPTLLVKAEGEEQHHTLSVDQRLGAELAMQHLLDLGHTKILHIAGPQDWLDARGRAKAWRTSLTQAGLPVPEMIVGDWTADFGYQTALELADRGDFTAVFVANDQMALGLLHGFHQAGLRVPEDISIVGFDDLPESKYYLPALTTVRQDFHEVGRRSVDVLLAALQDEEAPMRTLIAPELVVRESTARLQ